MTKLYRFTAALATVALALGATTAFAHPGGGHNGHHNGQQRGHNGQQNEFHGSPVLKSDVFGSQPTGPVLFGVPPGGAPWVITKGDAQVRRNGDVRVSVVGLVIPTPPSNGTNPVTNIAATVYCGGTAVGTTQAVPFSPAGDARIEDTLAMPLPRPCLAPTVLLNPAAGAVVTTTAYIAATGE
jgi:hypothetical protein